MIAPTETAELAQGFITDAIAANGGTAPDVVHADRGTSMTSKTVATLLADLGVTRSHSRPHVSNDNPYSEAQFKTLKYCPAFPGRFGSIVDARAFSRRFFQYYNHEHRPGLACAPRRRSMTAPPPPSAPNAPESCTRPTPPTRPGSAAHRPHPSYPKRPGSTNHPKKTRRQNTKQNKQPELSQRH
jgi:putative transposase